MRWGGWTCTKKSEVPPIHASTGLWDTWGLLQIATYNLRYGGKGAWGLRVSRTAFLGAVRIIRVEIALGRKREQHVLSTTEWAGHNRNALHGAGEGEMSTLDVENSPLSSRLGLCPAKTTITHQKWRELHLSRRKQTLPINKRFTGEKIGSGCFERNCKIRKERKARIIVKTKLQVAFYERKKNIPSFLMHAVHIDIGSIHPFMVFETVKPNRKSCPGILGPDCSLVCTSSPERHLQSCNAIHRKKEKKRPISIQESISCETNREGE